MALALFGHCNMSWCKFSCNIVSFTALNTNRMLLVSIAIVKCWKKGLLLSRFKVSNLKRKKIGWYFWFV